jgi:hypothetical protein
MVYSHPTHSQQQKSDKSSDLSNSIVNVKILVLCLIMFRLKDSEKTMQNINLFYKQKYWMVLLE